MSKQRDYQRRNRALGLCVQCGDYTLPSTRKGQVFKARCQKCSDKWNSRARAKRAERGPVRKYTRKNEKTV